MAPYPNAPYRPDDQYDNYPPERAARHRPNTAAWLIRLPMLTITGGVLFVLVMIIAVTAHQVNYGGLVYPGVSAYGVPLGGLNRAQALDALRGRFTYGSQAIFTFRDGAKTWQMNAADLGVRFDAEQTVTTALQIGRTGGMVRGLLDQWAAWTNGKTAQPMIVYDESKAGAFLASIAAQLDTPVQDATIVLDGAKARTTPSQTGRTVDTTATLATLRQVISAMNTGAEIPLVVRETAPEVKDSTAAGAKIQAAISTAIQLYMDGPKPEAGPWVITPDFISGLLSITRVEDGPGSAHYEVAADISPMKTVLNNLATTLAIEPVSARFVFNPNTRQIESIKDSVNGRSLNAEATLKRLQEMIFQPGVRRVALAFKDEIPTVNSRTTAQELGITQEIVRATTFFYGSSPERKVNVQVAASKFHGLVIAPGEVFSFNKYLGDVSPETGYETGLVIIGNQTIKGVGGGVCQVSSTVFQAAFFAGFPILERYPHGYRVGYYESGAAYVDNIVYKSGVGMDATVYGPIIDFKFKNDTPYHMLIETYFDLAQQSVTFKLYSTPTGRVVSKDGPTLSNPVPHGPAIYEESADMRAGQSRQVDYAVDGIDARVWRSIKKDGQIIASREEFYSHYLPWQARFQVARGATRN